MRALFFTHTSRVQSSADKGTKRSGKSVPRERAAQGTCRQDVVSFQVCFSHICRTLSVKMQGPAIALFFKGMALWLWIVFSDTLVDYFPTTWNVHIVLAVNFGRAGGAYLTSGPVNMPDYLAIAEQAQRRVLTVELRCPLSHLCYVKIFSIQIPRPESFTKRVQRRLPLFWFSFLFFLFFTMDRERRRWWLWHCRRGDQRLLLVYVNTGIPSLPLSLLAPHGAYNMFI